MRDILISTTVCIACLLLAVISQVIAPTAATAAAPRPEFSEAVNLQSAAAGGSAQNAFNTSLSARPLGRPELDPEDPNPTLLRWPATTPLPMPPAPPPLAGN